MIHNESMAERLPQFTDISATLLSEAVLAHALDTFGNAEIAESWLDTPNAALRNQTPRMLVNTAEGAKQVEEVLTRIDYGVFS